MENLGHIAGMLDRDQRTAKLRFFSDKQVAKTYSFLDKTVNESNANSNSIISRHRSFCPTRTKSSNSYLMWKNGYLLKNFHRLTNVLIVGVYLTLITLPSTSSAPINTKMSDRMNSRQEWINPCNINDSQYNKSEESDPNDPAVSNSVQQAQTALNDAMNFREEFASKTFGMTFDAVQDLLRDEPTWLDINLPISFGTDIPKKISDDLKTDEVLLEVYGFLQKVAVGLEQVVWDQEDNQGDFVTQFTNAGKHLKSVLCELQMAIVARGNIQITNVTRDIMKDEDRHLDITRTKIRDFKIFRTYINTLYYITKVFSS